MEDSLCPSHVRHVIFAWCTLAPPCVHHPAKGAPLIICLIPRSLPVLTQESRPLIAWPWAFGSPSTVGIWVPFGSNTSYLLFASNQPRSSPKMPDMPHSSPKMPDMEWKYFVLYQAYCARTGTL